MSLILEALKKSEAERRRGQSPDLFGATLGTPPPRREIPRVWPLLLLGLILLASAWMIWSGGSRGESVPPAEPVVVEHASTETSEARPAPQASPAPQPVASQPTPPPVAVTKPVPASAPTQVDIAPPMSPAFAPEPSVEPEAPAEEALPTLSALDAGSRAALPPLKLSMHVYANEPGKRFAIIDGQRITEGALLGPGVVESIRRDGVVLNINGRRLLLPKP